MRILFVVEHFYPYIGGVENLFYALGKSLVEEGHQVGVVTTRHDSQLPQRDTIAGMEVHRVNAPNRFFFTLMAVPTVWRLSRRYHLIHTTSYNAAWPAWMAGKLSRKSVIITFHEVWGELWDALPWLSTWQKRLYKWYETRLLKLSFHRFVAVSQSTAQQLQKAGVTTTLIKTIYNGISYEDFAPYKSVPHDARTFCYFGRIGASKGLNLLLPAWAEFAKEHPEAHLKLIIPKYPKGWYNQLLQQIEALHIAQSLTIMHELPRPKLLQEVAQSGCVVIPSYAEGFCFVAAEAVALGVPIISSDRGALPEVVGGNTVQLEEQSVEALVKALQKAWRNSYEHRAIKRFPLSDTVAQYKALYTQLL